MVRENMRSLDTVRFALLPRKMYGKNIYRGSSAEMQRIIPYFGNCMWVSLDSALFVAIFFYDQAAHHLHVPK
jgi:hypothetical protein